VYIICRIELLIFRYYKWIIFTQNLIQRNYFLSFFPSIWSLDRVPLLFEIFENKQIPNNLIFYWRFASFCRATIFLPFVGLVSNGSWKNSLLKHHIGGHELNTRIVSDWIFMIFLPDLTNLNRQKILCRFSFMTDLSVVVRNTPISKLFAWNMFLKVCDRR